MKKKCPRCGEIFDCKMDKSCWCNDYKIADKLSRQLKNKYKDCLCEKCLRELGAKIIVS